MPNYSTIPGCNTVITLGHTSKQPLIGPPSELVDGSEPHGYKLMVRGSCGECMDDVGGEEVYPGWRGRVGTGGGYTGYIPSQADLRLIYRILSTNRFILPFD